MGVRNERVGVFCSVCFCLLCKTSVTCRNVDLYVGLLLINTSVSMQVQCYFTIITLCCNLKLGMVISSTVFIVKYCFGCPCFFVFDMITL